MHTHKQSKLSIKACLETDKKDIVYQRIEFIKVVWYCFTSCYIVIREVNVAGM